MSDYRMSREQIVSRIRYLRDAERSRGDDYIITANLLDRLLTEVEAKRIKTPQVPRIGTKG